MRPRKVVLISALAASVLAASVLAGCGGQEEISSNPVGTNGQVGDILLRAVRVPGPPEAGFSQGADPDVWLTLLNDGAGPDELTSVTSPSARSVEILWDPTCDGTAEVVDALPLRATEATSPPAPDVPSAVPPFGGYRLRMVDLTQPVLSGTTVPLTFVFARAGQITLRTPVRPGQAEINPGTACVPVSSPPA